MAIFKKKSGAPTPKEVKVVDAEVVAKSASSKAKSSSVARSVSTLAMRTILAPLATEKTAHLADRGVYAFLVAKDANRIAVRQAFRELFKITPVKVNIIAMRGTMKRVGRNLGRTSDYKKAFVTLPKGSHINVFESV